MNEKKKAPRRGPRLPIARAADRSNPEAVLAPVRSAPAKSEARKPKPGAPDFSAFMNPRPVAREDVTEKELAFIGTVRHFAKLGFDLLAYKGLIFSAEEKSRSPEDRIAGELASDAAATFDRLLDDGVHFYSSPRLMGTFMVLFQFQDVARRRRWKKKFFAGWDAANEKTNRRRSLASIVLNLKATHTMGEIQVMHDRLARGGAARSKEEKFLKERAILGARVESLIDEARGALGLRTTPKKPRLKQKRRKNS